MIVLTNKLRAHEYENAAKTSAGKRLFDFRIKAWWIAHDDPSIAETILLVSGND